MVQIWTEFLPRYGDDFAICRFGDDLGFKTSTLVSPKLIREHVCPQYRRVIGAIKAAGKPFLWHSCGCIFPVMDDVIALGIDAKHSNEDCIAPFDEWIARYGDRIGLLGGIDVDLLCQKSPDEITETWLRKGRRFRAAARGYALGSGNSIPEYVPVDGYLAMIEGARRIRAAEEMVQQRTGTIKRRDFMFGASFAEPEVRPFRVGPAALDRSRRAPLPRGSGAFFPVWLGAKAPAFGSGSTDHGALPRLCLDRTPTGPQSPTSADRYGHPRGSPQRSWCVHRSSVGIDPDAVLRRHCGDVL